MNKTAAFSRCAVYSLIDQATKDTYIVVANTTTKKVNGNDVNVSKDSFDKSDTLVKGKRSLHKSP